MLKEGKGMRALLLDAAKRDISEVEPCELGEYQELMGCRCIDIVNREIAGKRYDIVCDDEGLFCCDPRISAIDDMGQPMLVGSLIIVGEARNKPPFSGTSKAPWHSA